jgi:hypothetical protein
VRTEKRKKWEDVMKTIKNHEGKIVTVTGCGNGD